MLIDVECEFLEAEKLIEELLKECIEYHVIRNYAVDEDGHRYQEKWRISFYYDGKLL